MPHPENGDSIQASAIWEIGRPPGTKPGATVGMPFAIPFGTFILDPGNQYLVQFSLDGVPRDEWRMPFTVREAPPQHLAAWTGCGELPPRRSRRAGRHAGGRVGGGWPVLSAASSDACAYPTRLRASSALNARMLHVLRFPCDVSRISPFEAVSSSAASTIVTMS